MSARMGKALVLPDGTSLSSAAGGSIWGQDFAIDGTTYDTTTDFTTASGSWSSNGTYISPAAPGAGTFARAVAKGKPWKSVSAVLLAYEVYIPSGAGGSAGIVPFAPIAGGNNSPIMRVDFSSSAITSFSFENDGVTGITSASAPAGTDTALDKWHTFHLMMIGGRWTYYMDGLPVLTWYQDVAAPAAQANVYPQLVAFQAAPSFRNIIGYHLSTSGITGRATIPRDVKRRTAGSVTINSNTYMDVDSTGALDLTVSAVAGDVLEISVGALWDQSNNNPTTVWSAVDAVTRVSGAPVNYISGNGSGGLGVMAWFVAAGSLQTATGVVHYTVQAGDVSGGTVTLRLRAKNAINTPETRAVRGSAGEQLEFAVLNIGS